LAADGVHPQLTFLLDLDPEAGLARATHRLTQLHTGRDRIEEEVLSFHQRVRNGYRAVAAAEPGRVAVLEAFRGIPEIEDQIRRRMDALLLSSAPSSDPGLQASG
jgi:dTMP kinase